MNVLDALPTGVRGAAAAAGGPPPFVVEPDGPTDAASLNAWLDQNRAWMRDALPRFGAMLFRGFAIDGAPAFESVARAIDPALKKDYLGTSPRDALTEYVFSASELPPYYPIPQHCEMSFTAAPPSRLFFWCAIAPRGEGGETPLVDVRRVYRDLEPETRARFVSRGVRNIRNYAGPDGGGRFDLWKLKPWHDMFQTRDRARVEELCAKNGFEATWRAGGLLRLTNTQPATRTHPLTGEPIWFNHSQVFHLSSVAGEYRRIAGRQRPLRSRLLAGFARLAVALKRRSTAVEDQAMHCTFGDGGEISDADMERVRDAIWKNLVCVPWRAGDVLAIDNFAVAHGRMPYSGPRRVAVCWA